MSAFDATLRVGEAGINVKAEDGELALEAELVLAIITIAPVGPNQFAPIPFGQIRIPMNKNFVTSLAQQLTVAAEQMKEPSKLEIANDLGAVEQNAANVEQFTERIR